MNKIVDINLKRAQDIVERARDIVAEAPAIQPSEPNDTAPAFAELLTTSNFSFLRGGADPEELIAYAVANQLSGLGLCDRNSMAGVVRAYTALKQLRENETTSPAAKSFRYVVGVRLVFADGTPDIIAYPTDRDAYGRLCRLLTVGNTREVDGKRATKGVCTLNFSDLPEFAEGQLFILDADEKNWEKSRETLFALRKLARGRVWLAAYCTFKGDDRARLNHLSALASEARVKLIASNNVLYHIPERRMLQDVVTCIREHMTIFEAGRRLEQNAERHIKSPTEIARLFREHPEAIAETQALLGRIGFRLDQLSYSYPTETANDYETTQETLERLTWAGAHKRYPDGISDQVKKGLWSELCLIAYKGYAPYFLTVEDIVSHARDKLKILCQGRGSAANSMVCFCLGVTEVDPVSSHLVFGRFLSTERDEPPDIDVDFEHERREEVIQYIYNKYGRHRAGLTATVVSYRSKGAIREVAKVFGISEDTVDALNELSWSWYSRNDLKPERVKELGLDLNDPILAKTLTLANDLMGFPRHLSQHVGGFVLTLDRLDTYVPVANAAMEDRTTVEWDKDDLDALNLLKVDVLALGMLSCIRRAFELMYRHYGQSLTLAGVRKEEALDNEENLPWPLRRSMPVYRMTHRADTIGVFQIESRAQMSMLPRLKPVEFYDFVIEVAIVRPGPIQGGMVHPYLKRRLGFETPEQLGPKLEAVLERTKGIPLFQEQAMQIAVVAAGFSPGKADKLRRAMATFRRNGTIHTLKDDFISGMITNSYPREFAERCFKQIEGFGDYGFPESHAASFAVLVYVSCWLKCHYPDVFACALLNSQPMGFYAPAQIIRDAAEHGVEVRPVDVNLSDLECVLEDGTRADAHLHNRHIDMLGDIWSEKSLRLGLSQVKGLSDNDANIIVARRGAGYHSIRDLWLRTGLPPTVLEKLAGADAFGSLGLTRRQALWAVRGLMGTDGAETLPLFTGSGPAPSRLDKLEPLPEMALGESVVHDYRTLTFSLKAHPVSFLRTGLDRRGTLATEHLLDIPIRPGVMIETAGLVLVRQRPGTASGVIFMTLEDETGIANIIVWDHVFQKNRRAVLGSRLLGVRGQLQREGLVTHLVAQSFTDLTSDLTALANGADFTDAVLARADEGRAGPPPDDSRNNGERRRREMLERQARAALPSGRNFH